MSFITKRFSNYNVSDLQNSGFTSSTNNTDLENNFKKEKLQRQLQKLLPDLDPTNKFINPAKIVKAELIVSDIEKIENQYVELKIIPAKNTNTGQ